MIEYVRDRSIFETSADILVNPVNTVGVMGAGLAKEFSHRYAAMYSSYRKLCLTKALHVGMVHLYIGSEIVVINFPTKQHWKDSSKIEYLESGLKSMLELLHTWKDSSVLRVALPKLGCGLGGLSWEKEVKSLFELYLLNEDIVFEVYL